MQIRSPVHEHVITPNLESFNGNTTLLLFRDPSLSSSTLPLLSRISWGLQGNVPTNDPQSTKQLLQSPVDSPSLHPFSPRPERNEGNELSPTPIRNTPPPPPPPLHSTRLDSTLLATQLDATRPLVAHSHTSTKTTLPPATSYFVPTPAPITSPSLTRARRGGFLFEVSGVHIMRFMLVHGSP